MRRAQVFLGWALLLFAHGFWNYTHGATPAYYDRVYGQQAASPGAEVPLAWLIAAVILWYLINGLHFILEWNRRPVMRFGRYIRTMGPGPKWLDPVFHDTLDDVSVQDVVVELPVHDVQTKDNVSTDDVLLLTYRINESKVKDAVVAVKDVHESILQRAVSTTNDVGATTELDTFLADRHKFCEEVMNKLSERVSEWGVVIKALELKSFKINDPDVEKAIAMKARAHKEAAAELTRAEMQEKISEKLDVAAKALSKEGWLLKHLEVLTELGRGKANTIFVPTTMLNGLGGAAAFGLAGAQTAGSEAEAAKDAAPAQTAETPAHNA